MHQNESGPKEYAESKAMEREVTNQRFACRAEKTFFPLRIAKGALSVSSWRQIYLFEITFYNNLDNIWVIWEHLLSLSFTYKSHANFLQQTTSPSTLYKEIAGMCEFAAEDF